MKKHRNKGLHSVGAGGLFARTGMAKRSGFTLVELLVVISIIGVLVGLLVPAVFAVRRTMNNGMVKFEVQSLADAVEKYRTKYGDYPPDGSDWRKMETHLRKAFPSILQSELNLLNPQYSTTQVPGWPALSGGNLRVRNDIETGNVRVMDPAEALVFFLGGFSADGQKPFTGKGGPFVVNGGIPVSNPQRENSFYEFNSGRLSFADDSFAGHGPTSDDALPVYGSYASTTPYVYFDSRTYQFGLPNGTVFFNYHRATAPSDPNDALYGVARPLLASTLATLPTAGYEAGKTFQILSPGIDGFYGWMRPGATPFILFSSTGQGYEPTPAGWVPVSGASKYRLPEHSNKQPMWDNVASCIEPPTFRDTTVNQ
ncbi:type II secretion system protein [Pirellulaceae bacterium SH467]